MAYFAWKTTIAFYTDFTIQIYLVNKKTLVKRNILIFLDNVISASFNQNVVVSNQPLHAPDKREM